MTKIEFNSVPNKLPTVRDIAAGIVFTDADNDVFIKDDEGGITRLADGVHFDGCLCEDWEVTSDLGRLDVYLNGVRDSHCED